ncbi:dnaJ homolog subfamily C member 7-like [Clytia hemisphaerica]|uniref:MYND-type domain-containing protein n=1 Tax=Clytia hemisphaerica TaxID=252671 RepID=A0A7M5VB03_9CNID
MSNRHCACDKQTEQLASLNSEGTRHYNNAQWMKAVNKFTDALEVHSCDMKTRSSVLRNRSSAYTKLKKFEQAKHDAKESIRLDPKHPKAFIKLAEAFEGEGDYEQACETYVHGMTQGDELMNVLSKKLEELRIRRNMPPTEAESQLGLMGLVKAKHCFVCRSKDNLSVCARCRVVYYCCREHQADDWKKHKMMCKKLGEARKDEKLMDRLEVEDSLPYLRVKRGATVPIIRQLHSLDDIWGYLECVASKEEIFKKRMANCLSWPMTLAFGLKTIRYVRDEEFEHPRCWSRRTVRAAG